MKYRNILRLLFFMTVWLLFQTSGIMTRTATAQEIIYDIGDIYYFSDGSYGVVCYVEPDNPHRGWVVSMQDVNTTGAFSMYDAGISVNDLVNSLGLETTYAINAWGQLQGWHFHGYENTRKLRESGHSPAANAVQLYSGWYIPDAMQMRQWYSMMHILKEKHPSMQIPDEVNEDSRKHYWTSTFSPGGIYSQGAGPIYMNYRTGELKFDAGLKNAHRIRPVRDFQVEDADAYWGPVDTAVRTGTITVKPSHTTEYPWHVVFMGQVYDGSGWAVVHPKYGVNDNPKTYDTVCASPERYTSVKNPNFTDLDISTPRATPYSKDVKLQTQYGCDSTIRIYYIVNPVYDFYDTAIVCADAAPYHWRGNEYNTSGDYEVVYKTVNGCNCDSTYHLHLRVVPLPDIAISPANPVICEGGSVELTASVTNCRDEAYDFMYYDGFDRASTVTSSTQITDITGNTSLFESGVAVYGTGTDAVRVGKYSSATDFEYGSITTKALDLSQPFSISLAMKGWGKTSGTIAPTRVRVSVDGAEADTVTLSGYITGSSDDAYSTYTLYFGAATDHSVITIESYNDPQYAATTGMNINYTEERFFIDAVSIRNDSPCEITWKQGGSVIANTPSVTVSPSVTTTYTVIAKNYNACVNSGEVTVQVDAIKYGVDEKSACVSYTWIDGHTYTASTNTPTWTLTSAAGCDSIVTLHLTISNEVTADTIAEACGSFTWHGQTYTESDDYEYRTTTVAGCDSVVTLHLTIKHSNTGVDAQVVCDSLRWIDGILYTENNNTATYTLTNAAGCDSVVTLNLTVNHSNTGVDAQVVCDSLRWIDGILYTENNNTATYTLSNAAGCDSVVTLNLTVNHSNTGVDAQVVCDSLRWIDGVLYTENNNTATYTLSNAAGCDSVVTLNLTVNHSNTGVDAQVVCDSLRWIDGILYTENNNTATYTLTNAAGCDSVVTLNLTVNHSNTGVDAQVVCDSLRWIDGVLYTENNNTATYTLTNVAGCDSVVTLNLTVNHSNTGVDAQVVCDSLRWIDGILYTENNNTATYTLTNVAGCDSVVTLNLTVNHSNTGVDAQVVCDSLRWIDGILYTENNNTATYTLTNVAGCDSVVMLNLTVNHSNTGVDAQVVCDSLRWIDGILYTENNNTATYTLTNAAGCDSVVTLNLTVNHSNTGDTIAFACNTFDWYEHTNITNSTESLTHMFTNASGCDSVVTLHLTVGHSNTGDTIAFACNTFDWYEHTNITNSTESLTHTFTNASGCDSVVTLHLTVGHSNTGDTIAFACDRFDWYEHTNITSSTESLTHTFTNASGCDSVVTLHLTVGHSNTGDTIAFACDRFDWYEHTNITSSTESLTHTFTNASGCDSVVTLHLTVGHSNTGDTIAFACDRFDWYEHTNITSSTESLTHTFTNASGCDSVVTLHLTVGHSNTGDTIAFACNTFDWYEHTNITNSTESLTHTFTNASGCDSVVTLHLTVGHSNTGDTIAFACDRFDWYEHTNITNSTESLTHTFTNASGCDSVVTLHLTVGHSNTGDTIAFACNTFDWYEHTNITNSTESLTHTFTNASGCDSVVTLHLTIYKPSVVLQNMSPISVCEGGAIELNLYTISSTGTLTFSWSGPNGFTSYLQRPRISNATTANAGTYTVTVTATEGTCTFTTGLSVDVEVLAPSVTLDNISDFAVCEGDTIKLNATVLSSNGDVTFTWSGPNSFSSNQQNPIIENASSAHAGSYTVVAQAKIGTCLAGDFKTVKVSLKMPTTGVDEQVACGTYTWIDGNTYTASNNTATFTLTNAAGCDSVVTLHLTINPIYEVPDAQTICASELPYEWNGVTFDAAGTQTVTLQTVNNCDSVVTMTLTVNPVDSVSFTATICAGTTYSDHNFTYAAPYSTTGSVHYDTIRTSNVHGCDSVVMLTLTVNPVDSIPFTATICAGTTYNDHGFTYAAPYSTMGSIHYDTIRTHNAHGCDSIVTLALTVNPVDSVSFTATICAGTTYSDHNFTYAAPYSTTGSVHYDTIRTHNVHGCDSIVTLVLTVNPVDSIHFDTETACAGVTYNEHGFTYAAPYSTTPTVHYDTIRTTNANGCDSIVTLILTVNPVDSIHFDTETVCAGVTYNGHGFTYAAPYSTTPTVHYDTIRTTNANGCDSIVTLILTVNPVDSIHFDTETVCAGVTYNDHGFTYAAPYSTTPTVHYDTIHATNANGCDSIVTLILTVNPVDSVHFDTETVCAGTTYSDHNFTYAAPYSTTPTVHYDTIRTTNANGCDSIVTLILTVNPVDSIHFDTETVCAGVTYNEHGFTYAAPYSTTPTVHYDTIRAHNANGCDSIVTLILMVNPVDSIHFDTETVCAGVTYNEHGFTYAAPYSTTPTVHYDTIHATNANGCDSIVTLILTVNPVDSVHFDTETVCAGTTYSDHNFTYAAPYSTTPTVHYDTIRAHNANGCDSIVTLILTVHPVDSIHFDTETVCAGTTYSDHNFTYVAPYSTTGSVHYDTIRTHNANGCDSIVTLILTVHPVDSIHFDTETVCAGTTYSEHGFTYAAPYSTTPTVHYDTIRTTNANGCDSIVTLILTVNPVDSIHFDTETVCAGTTYSDHNFTYAAPYSTTPTVHYDTILTHNANGCDSIVTLILTVNPVDSIHFDTETVCAGVTYNEHGFTYAAPYSTTPTVHYDTIRTHNANGCDSIVTLILTVNPVDSVHFDTETVCAGTTYSDHNFTYAAPYSTTPTVHYDTIRTHNANDCDSIVTLILTVNPVDSVHFDTETVCAGVTYNEHGFTYAAPYSTTPTVHYDTIRAHNANGCDSIVTLILTVNPVDSIHFDTETVCAGITYNEHGFTYAAPYSTTPTVHYDTIRTTNANGCDSIVTLILTVNPVDSIHFDTETVCAGTTYSDHNFTYAAPYSTTPTVHYDTIHATNADGCDSIVTLILTVNPVDSIHFDTEMVCAGVTYNEHGFTYAAPYSTTPTVHYDTIHATNANGCDSIVTLILTVHPVDSIHFDTETVCAGTTYSDHNFTYAAPYSTTPTVHYDTIRTTNANGCDSIVTLILTVNPVDSIHFDAETVCAGVTYNGHGFTYAAPYSTTPTVHYDTIRTHNANGCDSIVTLILTVNPVDSIHFDTETVCAGVTYNGHGFTYAAPYSTTPTVHYDTISTTNANGCDSIVTLILTVNPVDSVPFAATICAGTTYSDHGFTYTAPYSTTGSVYYDTIRTHNANGCDSIVTLTLTISPAPAIPDLTAVNNTSCVSENGTITVNTPTGSGYTYSLNSGAYQTEPVFGGLGTGNYTVTVKNEYGCVSSATANITTIGNTLTVSASADTSCSGHDLHLTSTPSTSAVTYEWSGPATFASTDQNPVVSAATSANAGTYTVKVTETATGCTATATVTAVVKNTYTANDAKTICASELPYTWNGVIFNTAGTQSATLAASNDCDSVVTMTLTVNPTYSVPDAKTICSSELPYTWNGVTFDAAGTQTVTLQTVNNCDSIVTMTLTVNPVDSVRFAATICAGTKYNDHGFTYTAPYSTMGSLHYDTIRTHNANGCDSIVMLALTVNPVDSIHFDTETVCAGVTYNGHGFTYAAPYSTTPTVHYDTIRTHNANGCDSIVTLILTVNPVDSIHFDTETVCAGTTYSDHNFTYAAPYSTTLTLHYDTIRTHNANGCDSIVTLILTVNPVDSIHFDTETVCAGVTYNEHGFTYAAPYSTTPTLHYDTIRTHNANGCDSIVTLILTVNPVDSVHFDTETVCAGVTYNEHGFTYAAPYSTTPTVHYDTIRAHNANGCDSIVTLILTVNPVDSIPFAETICAGTTYSGHGFTYTAPYSTMGSIHYDTIRTHNAHGCDSIVTLALTINPAPAIPDLTAVNNTSCVSENGAITVNTPTGSGYTYSLNSGAYQTGPTFGGLGTGSYTVTVKNEYGCISSATANITTIGNTLTVSASADSPCSGHDLHLTSTPSTSAVTYEWSGPATFASTLPNPVVSAATSANAGTYTVKVTETATGCTATATVTAVVKDTYTATDVKTICASELPYTWNGVTFSAAGTQSATLAASNGCDSVVTMTLTVNPTYNVTDAKTICASELPYTWNGVTFTAAGTQAATLQTVNHCDSVVTMTLTVNPTYSVAVDSTVCASELPLTWNGVDFTAAGTQSATLQTVNHCDSVVTMTLTVNPIYSVAVDSTVCANELPLTWNGVDFTAAGTQSATLQTVNHCDSVVTMTLTLKTTYAVTENKTVCPSALPYTWNGESFTAAGTKTVTLPASNGCDSVVTMVLAVDAAYAVTDSKSVCPNELPLTWNGVTFNAAGTQNATLTASNGCDSVVTMTLTVNPTYNITDAKTICASELPYVWNGVTFTAAGTQSATLQTVNHCDSVVTMTLTLKTTYAVTENKTVCPSALPYIWNGESFDAAGTKTVTLSASNGCDSVVTMVLTVDAAYAVTDSKSVCPDEIPYVWNGVTFNAAGTQNATLTASNGCDSVVTMTLTVKTTYAVTENKTVCPSALPYTWNGESFTAAGTKTVTLPASNGCDSVVTMVLAVDAAYAVTDSKSVCPNELPLTWNGVTFNVAGTQNATLTASNGCDSVVTMTLTLKTTYAVTENKTVCPSALPYTWNGESFDAAGTKTVTLPASNGCDSVVTMVLTVDAAYAVTDSKSVCPDEIPYVWNGVTFNAAGTQTVTLHASNGCDSVVTMTLTVKTTYAVTENKTVCPSALPYTWNGESFDAAGTKTVTLPASNGCDSVVTMVLTVDAAYAVTDSKSVCPDEIPYVWNGVTFNAAGTQTVTLHASNGCDSVVTMTLTLKTTYAVTENKTVCPSALPYTWNGESFDAAGTKTVTLPASNGCDSVVTMVLTVDVAYAVTDSKSVCPDEIPYVWNGVTFNAAGTQTVTLPASNGCDSVVTMTLTLKTTYAVTENKTVCPSALPYTWNGESFTAAGTKTVTLPASNGCDSVVTMVLAVDAAYAVTDSKSVCPNELPLTWNGVTFNAAGTQNATLTASNGCDSVVTMTLTLKTTYAVTENKTVCPSALPYTWNGESFDAAGTKTVTLPASNGCDSVVTMVLTVDAAYAVTDSKSVCPDEIPYVWNGVTFNAAGTQTVTLPASNGCDSVVTMTLTLKTTYAVTENKTVCPSALPYTWNGESFTAAGTKTVTLPASNGCDSVVTMVLTVKAAYAVTDSKSICKDELPYIWNGVTFSAAGTQSATLAASNGCDSVVTMTLTVNPTYNVTDAKTICASELPYTWNGVTFTAAGTQSATLQTVNHCDSVVTMTLTVNPTYNITDAKTICASELPYVWNGVTFTAAGTQSATLQTVNHCDSVVTMTLTVKANYAVTENKTVCPSALPYTWNGESFTAAGTKTVTLPASNGCDSVVTMVLAVDAAYAVTDSKSVCPNELPLTWNGVTFNAAGTQSATLTASNGCDSVVTMTLTVKTTYAVTENKTVCPSALPYTWNGESFTAAGTKTVTLPASNGCDSVVTMTLTVKAAYSVTDSKTVCQNALPYDWNGVTFNAAGTQTVTLPASNGCDSVVTMTLTVKAAYSVTDSKTVCQNALPYDWNGVTFNAAGTKTVTLPASNGCDSVVTMTLTVKAAYSVTDSKTVCQNALPYDWNGVTFNAAGTQSATLTAANGCDSVVTMTLTVNPTYSVAVDSTVCANELPLTWNGVDFAAAGTQSATLQTVNHCDSVVTMTLTVKDAYSVTDSKTVCQNALPYDWNGVTFNAAGTQTVTLPASNGCDSVVTMTLTVKAAYSVTDSKTVCQNALPYDWNGVTFNAAGTQTVTLPASNGCDSVVTMTLTVKAAYSVTDSKTVCQNALPYDWNGVTFNAAGTQTVTLPASNGCDSVVTMTLTVNPIITGDTTAVACEHFTWYGTDYTSTPLVAPTHTFTAANGCDSVVTLHLTINHSTTGVDVHKACYSYTWIDGITYTASTNTPTWTLTNAAGCDSIVTLHLTIGEPHHQAYTHYSCEPTYTWINGATYDHDGDYTYPHYDANGCLQVDTLHLTLGVPTVTYFQEIKCDFYVWDGDTLDVSGYYTKVYTGSNGCDSIVNLNLDIHHGSTTIYLYDTVSVDVLNAGYYWHGIYINRGGYYTYVVDVPGDCDTTYNMIVVPKCDYVVDYTATPVPPLCSNNDAMIEVTDVRTNRADHMTFPPFYFGMNVGGSVVWVDSNDVGRYVYDSLSAPGMKVIIVRDGNGCFTVKQVLITPGPPHTLICPPDIVDTLNFGETYVTLNPATLDKPTILNWDPTRLVYYDNIPPGYKFEEGDNVVNWLVVDTVCADKSWTCTQHVLVIFPKCPNAVDCEGNVYAGVRIGSECWTQRNLESLIYGAGCTDSIPCVYEYSSPMHPDVAGNVATFGRLYCFEAAVRDSTVNSHGHIQGICPDGWYLPTPEQYESLYALGGYALKTPDYWVNGGGINSSGFTWLPAGIYNGALGRYEGLLTEGRFWSVSVEHGAVSIIAVIASYSCDEMQTIDAQAGMGYSIRCIKEKE